MNVVGCFNVTDKLVGVAIIYFSKNLVLGFYLATTSFQSCLESDDLGESLEIIISSQTLILKGLNGVESLTIHFTRSWLIPFMVISKLVTSMVITLTVVIRQIGRHAKSRIVVK